MYRSSRCLQQASTNIRDPTANPSVAGGTPGASGTLCRVAKKINKPPGQQKTSRQHWIICSIEPVFVPVKRCNAIPISNPVCYLACPCTIQRGNYVAPTDFWVRSLKTNHYLLSLSLYKITYTRISCWMSQKFWFRTSFPTLLGILFQKGLQNEPILTKILRFFRYSCDPTFETAKSATEVLPVLGTCRGFGPQTFWMINEAETIQECVYLHMRIWCVYIHKVVEICLAAGWLKSFHRNFMGWLP